MGGLGQVVFAVRTAIGRCGLPQGQSPEPDGNALQLHSVAHRGAVAVLQPRSVSMGPPRMWVR
jgi:hypothetical protein